MRSVLLLLALTLCAGCKRGAKEAPTPTPDDRANAKAASVPAPTPQPVIPKEVVKKESPAQKSDGAAPPRTPEPPPISQEGRGDHKKPLVDPTRAADLTKPAPGVQPKPQPGVVPVPPLVFDGQPQPGVVAPDRPPVVNPAAPVQPLAPAGNTPRGAAKRLVAMADMRDLQVFIDTASLVDGNVPSAADILKALEKARSPVFNMVADGSVTLTGIRQREGVWAFETAAYLNGGLAVSQNGVERLTADELRKRLGK